MSNDSVVLRIPEEVLAEQWYTFVYRMIEGLRAAYQSTEEPELTQKTIAQRLGKKPSFVSRCFSGKQNMTIRTIHDLARAMGCRVEVTFRPLRTIPRANDNFRAAASAETHTQIVGDAPVTGSIISAGTTYIQEMSQ